MMATATQPWMSDPRALSAWYCLCTGPFPSGRGLALRGRREGTASRGHHMAASWPSTILNCCVLLARSLTRSTMSFEAAGEG